MNYDLVPHNRFSKTFMTGVLIGLIAAIASLVYNSFFRMVTQFEPSQLINVATIIFAMPILLIVDGLVYYALGKFRFGSAIHIILSVIVTLLCIVVDFHIQRSTDPVVTATFRKLLLGIILISGISSFFIPYVATHENAVI